MDLKLLMLFCFNYYYVFQSQRLSRRRAALQSLHNLTRIFIILYNFCDFTQEIISCQRLIIYYCKPLSD